MASGSQIGSGLGSAAGFYFGGPFGAALGSFAGGIIGGLFDEGPDVQAYINEMAKLYEGILPPDLSKAIVYAQYKQGGTLTPQQLSQLPIEAQQAIQLVENPEFKQKQKVQLQQLEQLAQTGMGPQEMLALEQSRRAAASDAQARFKTLMQQYQQMGQVGGGASLAAQLQSAQAADDREAMSNMQAAAMAAENRRSAIQQAFQAASGMRQQDLQVNQYNTENRRQKQMFDIQNALTRQQQNAQYANQANMFNLQRQQQVADMNMQQLNQELYRQQFLAPQQMFQNQMALANAKAGVLAQKAGLAQQQAQMQSQANMNFMTGLAQMGMAYGNYEQGSQFNKMYAAKEGLVSDGKGGFMRAPPVAPNPPPPAIPPMNVAIPPAGYYDVQPAGIQGFNQAFNQQMQTGPITYGPNSPMFGPEYNRELQLAAAAGYNMGVGGNQAGLPLPYGTYGGGYMGRFPIPGR